MTIATTENGSELTANLEGRLDTVTAPQLETQLKQSLGGKTKLIIDMEQLSYISSAGLRVILSVQKIMNRQGELLIRHVCPEIMEIFEITGFADILNIE